jgi:transcription elongation factor Elf1
MARQFDPGDHVTATCGICGVKVTEPLTGRYDEGVYAAAVDKCTEWMQAHLEQFHAAALSSSRQEKSR